jgi:hypothetical protein
MKKIGFLSILALVLASGLVFMSCWTTGSVNEPTQFEGRWLNLSTINDFGYTDFSYTFTGNTFAFRQVINEAITIDQILTGTFKYTDTKIQFTREKTVAGNRTWTQKYTLIGNELFLGNSNLDISPGYRKSSNKAVPGTGAFIKQ